MAPIAFNGHSTAKNPKAALKLDEKIFLQGQPSWRASLGAFSKKGVGRGKQNQKVREKDKGCVLEH